MVGAVVTVDIGSVEFGTGVSVLAGLSQPESRSSRRPPETRALRIVVSIGLCNLSIFRIPGILP
jgi:hypothetical protein